MTTSNARPPYLIYDSAIILKLRFLMSTDIGIHQKFLTLDISLNAWRASSCLLTLVIDLRFSSLSESSSMKNYYSSYFIRRFASAFMRWMLKTSDGRLSMKMVLPSKTAASSSSPRSALFAKFLPGPFFLPEEL